MASRIVPPHVGEKVVVVDSLTEEEVPGTVIALLNTQFVYETENGTTRYHFYKQPWRSV